jgi:tRNA (guanine10-N2)-methyltransferase
MPDYLLVFAQSHSEFRLPELESVAELHGFTLSLPTDCDPSRPFLTLHLELEEHARLLASRCILIKSSSICTEAHSTNSVLSRFVFALYARGGNYDELHVANKANFHLWSSYANDISFKFLVTAYNHKIAESRQRDVVEGFAYMNFLGKIDLKNPEIVLGCFEECVPDPAPSASLEF